MSSKVSLPERTGPLIGTSQFYSIVLKTVFLNYELEREAVGSAVLGLVTLAVVGLIAGLIFISFSASFQSSLQGNVLAVNAMAGSSGSISVTAGLKLLDQQGEYLSEIDWGAIDQGENVSKTIMVQNIGKTDLYLRFIPTEWDPVSFSEFMTLSWDYNGTSLRPQETLIAVLTLSVAQNITTVLDDQAAFKLDMCVQGSTV